MASLTPHNGILGLRKAKHLLRRATFSLSKSSLDSLAQLNASDSFDQLTVLQANTWSEPYDPLPNGNPDGYWTSSSENPYSFAAQGRKRMIVTGWWWYNAMQQVSIKHKLSFFLHTSFTVSKDNGAATSSHFFDHIKLLDHYACGNLKTLAKKITFDNSMLDYLDNTTNNANNPNENYAREFLELFTILKGPQIADSDYTNYTEWDVQQAARVFSGVKMQGDRSLIDTDTGIPKGRIAVFQHDQTDKEFSHAFDNQIITGGNSEASIETELDTFVEMVFDKDATAISFVRKLYRFFVKSEWDQEVEDDIIIPLATQLKNDNYEILPTVKTLLTSQHFFDTDDVNSEDEIIGAIVKSPLQLMSEVTSHFDLQYSNPDTEPLEYLTFFNFLHTFFLQSSGMTFYSPDSVAGYPAHYQEPDFDRHWFSSNTVLGRYKLIESYITGRNKIANNNLILVTFDIIPYIANQISNPSDANAIVVEMTDRLFPESIDEDRKTYFKDFLLEGFDDTYWTEAWVEYGIDNDDSVVRTRLNALITAIINSSEFQLT